MRDIKRIKPFIKKLEKLWLENPDLRFGQLIMIISKTEVVNPDLFYIEEEDFLKKIDEFKKSIYQNKT